MTQEISLKAWITFWNETLTIRKLLCTVVWVTVTTEVWGNFWLCLVSQAHFQEAISHRIVCVCVRVCVCVCVCACACLYRNQAAYHKCKSGGCNQWGWKWDKLLTEPPTSFGKTHLGQWQEPIWGNYSLFTNTSNYFFFVGVMLNVCFWMYCYYEALN